MEPWLADACRLLHAESTVESREAAVRSLAQVPGEVLLPNLLRHRIDQLVLRTVLDGGWAELLGEELHQALVQRRRRSAMELMLREEGARRAGEALASASIDYVFFKGLLLGEMLYGDPLLRPSADVDLMIAEGEREQAHWVLVEAGFELVPQEDQPPYEQAYFGHGAHLDLHWHPISPTRSRGELTPYFLNEPTWRDGLAYPPNEATALSLLLNPALTDHVSERLIQALDVDRFVRNQECNWQQVGDWLRSAGLRVAAWAMLEHTRLHFDTPIPEPLDDAVRPGALRRRYLRAWLVRDPAQLYTRWPRLVRAGLGTFLHDSLGHGFAALVAAVGERRKARRR